MITIDNQKIAKKRAEKGFTLRELSLKSGVSANSLSKIETGKTVPRILTISKIAKALGIDIEDLKKD